MSPTSYQLLHPAMWVPMPSRPSHDLDEQRTPNVHKVFPCAGAAFAPLKPQNHRRCLTINPFPCPLPHNLFVNIVGSPNVGKSTLMNRLVGERLSIINAKAQTTRHRIMGIVNEDDYQIVYSDTPGVLDPAYKLQEGMMKFVKTALQDADVLLVVTDVNEQGMAHPETLEKIAAMDVPTFVLVNKIDLATDQTAVEAKLDAWAAKLPRASVVPISALHNFNVDTLLERIVQLPREASPSSPRTS